MRELFWLQVLTDLNNRGVKDILVASVDGLKGFPEAIKAIFLHTEVQLCIVHQIRNCIRYVASKNQKEFMRDLKLIYQAISKKSAYFKYTEDIRIIIYITNIIESVYRQFRKFTKTNSF